jgi:hypothetical protein
MGVLIIVGTTMVMGLCCLVWWVRAPMYDQTPCSYACLSHIQRSLGRMPEAELSQTWEAPRFRTERPRRKAAL